MKTYTEKLEDAVKQQEVWPSWRIRMGILEEEAFNLGHLMGRQC